MPFHHPMIQLTTGRTWTNFHGNLSNDVRTWVEVDLPGPNATRGDRERPFLARHASAIQSVIDTAVREKRRLRPMGSRWSLSNIARPDDVLVDPWRMSKQVVIPPQHVDAAFQARFDRGHRLVYVQGGTEISRINRFLADRGLALQTSGAADGHRLAGCIATGTHGAALDIGAVHDTVLGFHMFAHEQALFIQPAARVLKKSFTERLEDRCEIPTKDRPRDDQYAASQVSLGSLGFMFAAVVEAVPLYLLRHEVQTRSLNDVELWAAANAGDPAALLAPGSPRPYNFSVLLNPYGTGDEGAYVSIAWKLALDEIASPPPLTPRFPPEALAPTKGLDLIGRLSDALDDDFSTHHVKNVMSDLLAGQYGDIDTTPRYPGQVFGATGLPPGPGVSSEFVVEAKDSEVAVKILLGVIQQAAARGKVFLGPLGLRFVAKTGALLGMNQFEKTCFIEAPAIGNQESKEVLADCSTALRNSGLTFTMHWGQNHDLDRPLIDAYYGGNVQAWLDARTKILTTKKERDTFESPSLADVGL